MWNFLVQQKIRALSCIFGLIGLAALCVGIFHNTGSVPGAADWKALFTSYSVFGQGILPQVVLSAIPLSCIAFLVGVPTILVFLPLMVLLGAAGAFLIVVSAQVFGTWSVLGLCGRKGFSGAIDDPQAVLLRTGKPLPGSMAFWPRLYILFPQRTIDAGLSYLVEKTAPKGEILFWSLAGTMLRVFPTALFAWSGVHLVIDFKPFEETLVSSLLLSIALMVVSYLLPKIPEILVCPDSLKPFLVSFNGEAITTFEETPVKSRATQKATPSG